MTRPARENDGFELRAMCMDTAGSPTQPYKILYGRVVEPWYRCTHSDTHGPEFKTIIFSSGSGRHKNGVGTVQILRRYPPPRLRSLREREKP